MNLVQTILSHWYKFKAYFYKKHRFLLDVSKTYFRGKSYTSMHWVGSSSNTCDGSTSNFQGCTLKDKRWDRKQLAHTMMSMLTAVEWCKCLSVHGMMEKQMLFRICMTRVSLPQKRFALLLTIFQLYLLSQAFLLHLKENDWMKEHTY